MKIELVPMRMNQQLEAELAGDCLVLNGIKVDFAAVGVKAPVDAASFDCEWIVGEVTRTDGEISVSLILPHGADAPDATRFPVPVRCVADGPIALPAYDAEADLPV